MSIFVGSIRYRLPIEPFLIVFAGLSFSKLVDYAVARFGMQQRG